MVAQLIKRWLRQFRKPPVQQLNLGDKDPELEAARRRLAASSRLVCMHSNKSARAQRHLNRILALKIRALDNIGAAEAALTEMDRVRGDDK